ncbi:MAG: dihydroorotase [Pelagibacteraceae bacterium]|jgi:dihydroorotase|nr:dihydroorotase [Pelagibacteraceae bacterium]|tara:strand:- start:760 stop:2073 length:1314 start_codon:yes stop_codon:yes gene_type:complete
MSDNFSLIIKNGSCYIDGKLTKTDIGLSGAKIKKIGKIELNSSKVYDATDKVVLPGIIDTQVHFREPGSTDAEDLESGSRAAVLGGITSLFEMPNTNPPTANLIEFEKKLKAAKNRMHSNYAFYFGATPDNTDQLADLKNVEGCCGVKLFAGSSTGNLLVDKEADIEKVISSSNRIVSIHSEDEDIIKLRKKFIKKGDVHSHPEWRNVECAMSSTRRVVKIAERYNKKIHVLHVTTKDEVDFLAMHKKNVTFETTPQHLTLYAPDCYDKLGTYAQMNPPLRTKEHYDRLWVAIKNNIVDVLGSDHAPHLKVNKDKVYPETPSGMPGVQTIFPVMLDHVNNGKISLEQLINLMCENPCRIFGIKNKGYIKEGFDADLTIADMNKEVVIKDEMIASKCGWTPFNNYKVKGFPVGTIVNGNLVMSDGKVVLESKGQPLKF